jgi:hypothetical protein
MVESHGPLDRQSKGNGVTGLVCRPGIRTDRPERGFLIGLPGEGESHEIRPSLAELAASIVPVHIGHSSVRDQYILWSLVQDFDSLLTAVGEGHLPLPSEGVKLLVKHAQKIRIIIDEEDS